MADVKRIYVEKKEPFAVKSKELKEELKNYLGINGIEAVRVLIRYDVECISDDIFEQIEQRITENAEEGKNEGPKHIVENGKTFVDITEQYVKKETVIKTEETKNETAIVQKKKIRTFNEIFADFFKGFLKYFKFVIWASLERNSL